LKFWAFVVGAAPLPPEVEEFWLRMGFAVIQGYGLTETAPIVTLNHPFRTSKGSVGTPIGGVEVRIADDGEILVRGENVTSGYYEPDPGSRIPDPVFDSDGWFHTGDIGERDEQGRIFIKGRKKEMIVTPEGLNVFPEDVERTLNALPGVRESAVVGVAQGGEERVYAVMVLDPGEDKDAVVRTANSRLQDHQRIRGASVWSTGSLPRTEGTRKLKRAAIRDWVQAGEKPVTVGGGDSLESLIARFAHGRDINSTTTLEELGLSSLERVELMIALEDRFQTRLDEGDSHKLHVSAISSNSSSSRVRSRRSLNPSSSRRGIARGPYASSGACRKPFGFCRWLAPSRGRESKAVSIFVSSTAR
jgi:long-chain acyl-CoA synthetase